MVTEKARQEIRAMYVKLFMMREGMPQAKAEQEADRRMKDVHVSRKTLAKVIQKIGIEKKRQTMPALNRRMPQRPARRR